MASWRAMPLVPLAAVFAGGVALAPVVTSPVAWIAWAAAGLLGAVLALLARPAAAAPAVLVAVAAVGAVRALVLPLPADHVGRLELPRASRIEGRLAGEPTRWTAERARLSLEVERVDDEPRSGRVQLTAYGVLPALTAGQRIALDARLDRPIGFRNPGTFDYGEYLIRHGVVVVGTTRGDRILALEPEAPPWPVRVRRQALAAMREALPPTSAALLAGLLLGDRTGLPPDVDTAFRRAGVYHVLAVSGFNVALIASTVWALLTLARAPRRAAALGAIVTVLGFAAIVGPEPSVIRATIMAVLILCALLLEREASVLNGLALAAIAILAVRPVDLHDPGFQLSFAATAGLVLAGGVPRTAPSRLARIRGWIVAALVASAAAQLAVLPITLTHFNQVSTIGVIANLAVVPLAGLATVLGLLAVAVGALSATVATWLYSGVWPVLLLLRGAVALAAAVPGAVLHLPAPGPLAIVGYVVALGLGLAARHLRATRRALARRLALVALAMALASALLALWPVLRSADGRLHVTVLDVGQGDAIVVEGPDGRAVLVDAGAGGPYRLDAGERVVAPFLWNRGILRLAAAVVTHADIDHAGGMAAVRDGFTIDQAWDGTPGLAPLALGGATVTPLASALGGRNDAARVLRIEFGQASILLASDIEAAGEQALIASGAVLRATALKVPHHGSRTSSSPEMLNAVRPAVALISVGARNSYGHPDPGVLTRLTAAGSDVYRTDRDGALLLETDGHVLTVTAWVGRRSVRYCLDPETIC
jgi:competence protein ComEC